MNTGNAPQIQEEILLAVDVSPGKSGGDGGKGKLAPQREVYAETSGVQQACLGAADAAPYL